MTVQVLTQAREHIIKKTFEAVKGAPHARSSIYITPHPLLRESRYLKRAKKRLRRSVDGAKLLLELHPRRMGTLLSSTARRVSRTEVDYAGGCRNAVLDVWKPTADNKAIINIPTTVENAMPHVFACQLEYVDKNLNYRDNVILCLHPHNDRGLRRRDCRNLAFWQGRTGSKALCSATANGPETWIS